jgi:tetratricopeptide (TPR) repeat protein
MPSAKAKKGSGPKREPMPRTEISYGELQEAESETDVAKKNPALQAKLRDGAREAYQKALKLEPNNADAYRHLARLYAKIGDYERAFDAYRKALAMHPKDAALWYDLGQCHNRRKQFNDSIPCFERALELDPENREYMKKLGFTLAWTGQVQRGLNYLTRAQGLAMAHYNVGRVLLERNQPAQAQQHFALAVRENPQLEPLTRELLTPTTTVSANRRQVQ